MPRFDINDYVDVQTRIAQFWQDYPDGRIVTYMISDPNIFERVVMRAEVFKHREHLDPDAADLAAEEKGQGGMANQTSWHENASTSAIGRALANMGYATSAKDRPSRQEMEKVARGNDRNERRSLPGTENVGTRKVDQRTGEIEDDEPVMAKEGQVRAIKRIWEELGKGERELVARLMVDFAQEAVEALTQDQAGRMIGALDEELRAERAAAKLERAMATA